MAIAQLMKRPFLILGIMLVACNSLNLVYAGYPDIFREYLEVGPATSLKLDVYGRDKLLAQALFRNN